MSSYQTTALPELNLLQHTATAATPAETGPAVAGLFGRLIPTMQSLGMDVDQPTVAWYDDSGERMRIGVGVPVDTAPEDAADLQEGRLAAVPDAVVVRYRGPLSGLQQQWVDLHGYLAAQGKQATGPCREIYLRGSTETDDWEIDLQQPVAGDRS